MKRLLLLICLMPLAALATPATNPAGYPTIEMKTALGDIVIELYPEQAPLTVANFLRYVEKQAFDGGTFYRTVRDDNQPDNKYTIDVIQGGPVEGFAEFEPIVLERTSDTGILHREGVISMARAEEDTATAHFFICVEEEMELDFGGRRNPDRQGFAAFGRVIRGMDVVRAIHQSAAEAQALQPPIDILAVTLRE